METVKDYLKAILKESLKFALFAMILFVFLGSLSVYMILYVLHTDPEISSLVAGAIIAVIIFIIDWKKFHFSDRIADNNLKMWRLIFKTRDIKKEK